MTALVWVGVFFIGGAGSVLRFVIDGAVASRRGRDFPYGTLAINLSGSVVLGLVTGLALSENGALLAGTAAVGSYTTFSTWMFETERLTEEREAGGAAVNVVASVILGVAGAALGKAIGGAL
jgi:CrcB protein